MYKIDKFLDFLLEKVSSGKVRIYYSDKLREIFKEIKFRFFHKINWGAKTGYNH